MDEPGAHELTKLLRAWGDGDEEAQARIVPPRSCRTIPLAKNVA
jgi:hypothetical protein